MQPTMILNFGVSCLYLLNARITDIWQYAWFYVALSAESRAFYRIDRHPTD